MSQAEQARELLARIRNGDQDAANELFYGFANRLVRLARSRLDLDLRRMLDPDDVVQSVFGSFFRRHGAGEFDVQSWESLWSLLAVITVHKCGHKIRYYRAAKRDAGQELSALRFTDDSVADWEAVAKDPTPSHTAMFNEALEELMRSLEERERQMLMLHLQGLSIDEISEKVCRSRRTVRRVLDRIRNHLEGRCGCDG